MKDNTVLTTLPDDPLCRLFGRAAFEEVLQKFWEQSGVRSVRPPRVGWREIDLFMLFEGVRLGGGIDSVRHQRAFQPIAQQQRLSWTATNAGNALGKTYQKWLEPCERELSNAIDAAVQLFTAKMCRLKPGEHIGAVVCTGITVNEIESDEAEEFPAYESARTDLFLDVRNHIIRAWWRDPSQCLSVQQIVDECPSVYEDLVRACFRFLQRRGTILFGAIPLRALERPRPAHFMSVMVIGGGIAGLGAARHLQLCEPSLAVHVFEARSRLGGRICTDRQQLEDVPIDLGAMIVTGMRQNPLGVIAKNQLGLRLCEVDTTCPIFVDAHQILDSKTDLRIEQLYNEILSETVQMRRLLRDSEHLSLGDVFRRILKKRLEREPAMYSRMIDWHVSNLEYACAAPLEKLSLCYWDQDDPFGFEGEHCMIEGGFDQLTQALAADLDVSVCRRVRKIDWSADPIQVVFDDGATSFADFVVLALPLGVIRDPKSLQFIPELPAWKRDALRSIGNGNLNKVVLRFSVAFWLQYLDQTKPSGLVQSFGVPRPEDDILDDDGRFYLFWDLSPLTGKPILMSMLPAIAADAMEQQPDDEIVAACMQRLRTAFPEAPDPLASVVTRWRSDRLAQGAYSYVPVGSSGAAYDAAAEPVDGRLFFAGEYTSRKHPTTAGGAYLSGLRAASELLRRYEEAQYAASNRDLETPHRLRRKRRCQTYRSTEKVY
jgi:lysine-specific histone demethylase 1